MSIDTILSTIEKRFKDNWTATDIDNNVRFANIPFKPPQGEAWASIDVRWMPSGNISISSTIPVRRRGLIVIDLFSPLDDGTGSLGTLSDSAIDIFENKQFPVTLDSVGTSIQCWAADVRHIGVPNVQGTDPMWYKYSIRIEFFRDE